MEGKVYWITGLSGSGKTTIGRLLQGQLLVSKPNVVFLDGDILREVFGSDLGHSREDRLKSAMRNARLCKMLSAQGIDVVCSTISLFYVCQEWNRKNIPGYIEILLDVPIAVLRQRDSKGIYSSDQTGDVVGVDITPEHPRNPDYVIFNDGTIAPEQIVERLLDELV